MTTDFLTGLGNLFTSSEDPEFKVIGRDEAENIAAGFYIPRKSTVQHYSSVVTDSILGDAKVGFHGGYVSGSDLGGRISTAPSDNPYRYIFNYFSIS